jgi:class 3 adenylate cyclase/tetratricopeptide (TPR) repeat protein
MVTCKNCEEENPELARFCQVCGAPLTAEAPAREARKTVSVVFCDVTGSTALGEQLDPESLRRVMTRYFEEMRAALERHGGTVEKFIGDAVMAVFGIPIIHEDDALRAVRAASEMRTALGSLNTELERDRGVTIEIRLGVNTGEVMAGDPTTRQSLVIGDAVNVAARLEDAASPGEVLISEATYLLVRDAVTVEPVGSLVLKGRGRRLATYRLLQVVSGAPAHARRFDASMVGRRRQLDQLNRAFEGAAADGTCHLFTVLGAAGVGKSRLVREFLASVTGRAIVLQGRCLPYGEGITFWPVVEVVREAAGIDDEDTVAEARSKIVSLVEAEDEAGRIVEGVAHAIGLRGAAAAPDETFWSIRKLLEAIARRGPLVVVFEDLHWAQPTFLDLVEHIADWTREASILLVCLARQELLDRRATWGGGKLNATTIHLEPLSENESEELIDGLLGKAGLDTDVRNRLTEAAGGNPLFVEEMISMLIDEGFLGREDGRWVATGDISEVPVPPSIQALLAARLDQLDPDEGVVIERASVEGMVFHRGAVMELCPKDIRAAADERLTALLRRELIRPDRSSFVGDEAFRFRHVLIRDAAYQAMPKQLRAELHERFADWLGRVAGDRIQEYEEILGYHLEQAYRYQQELGPTSEREQELVLRAAGYLSAAARRATARIDMPAAVGLYGRAVALLPKEGPEYPKLLWELGTAINRLGENERAEGVLTEAVALASASGDADLEARARLDRWWARAELNVPGFSEGIAREVWALVPTLEDLGDDLGLTKAWQLLALVQSRSGQFEAMRAPLERAVVHARRAGDRLEEAETLESVLEAYLWGRTPVLAAIRKCEEIIKVVEGDRRTEASVWATLGTLHAMLGNFAKARALIVQQRETLRDLGLAYWVFGPAVGLWQVEILAGDPAAAEREVRSAYGLMSRWSGGASLFTSLLAHAIGAQERFEEAARFAELSKESAGDWIMDQIGWRTASAKALARLGDPDRAIELAAEAVEMAERTDAPNLQGNTLMILADVLAFARLPGEARSYVDPALRLFELKGNVVSARMARDTLELLGVGH